MLAVDLSPDSSGSRRACLRALCGLDEVLVESGAPHETLSLLERLLIDCGDGLSRSDRVRDLPVCDVDRLVAALFVRHLGEQIESRALCATCDRPFEISFSLADLMQACEEVRSRGLARFTGPDPDGGFSLADGRRFRLPAVRDLEAVGALGPSDAMRQLRQECVLEGDPEADPEALDDAMASVGPVLDTDVEGECPECGHVQRLRFDVQRYFGRALAVERRYLNVEVHQLARAYGWQRSEILSMTREDRRAHAKLILAGDAASLQRSRSAWP